MSVLWRMLRERGIRRIAPEDPASPSVRATVEQAGLEVAPVWVDEHGLDVARLESTGVDAVVLAPAHQYPTGAVLAPARRARLIEWARRRGALVVEYESDAEYRYGREPLASLQGVAPDRVVYIGTANTTLAPAVRLAWMVMPLQLLDEVASHHDVANAAPSVRTQAAYASMLERGEIDRHLRQTRHRYQARRNALIDALSDRLPEATVGGAALGLHVIAWLPDDTDAAGLAD
jgi:GntR family transcriptional regulator/MocR family aminotransferase